MTSLDFTENDNPDPILNFYMDENIDFDITVGLRRRGIDVITVQEDGKVGISDPEVMDRAIQLHRVVFTNDDDLLREATQRQGSGIEFNGVIYIHKRDVIIGYCIEALDLIARTTDLSDFLNNVEWLRNFW